MKKLISLILTVAFVLSLGVAFAPATAADDVLPELRPDAEVALVDGCLLGVAPGSSADDVAALFTENVHVIDHIGQDRTGDDLAATGWRVAAASASATVIICGDTSCDGKINVRDVVAVMKSIADGESLRFAASGDVSPDGAVNAKDVVVLMKYLVGYDVTLGEIFFRVDASAKTAPAEDETLKLFFTNSLEKFARTDEESLEVALKDTFGKDAPRAADFENEHTFEMKLARNERESCFVQLYSEAGHKGLNAALTPFTNGKGEILDGQLLFVDYIKLNDTAGSLQGTGKFTGAVVPDALPPLAGAFNVAAKERQALYVEVSADEDTAAGLYRATLDITDAAGNVIKTATVYANVWDFAIPAESRVRTAFGLNASAIIRRAGRLDDVSNGGTELYIEYYEYLLDNRLNGWCLPYNPIDSRADVWMDDPRVNTFLVAGGYGGDVYNNGMCGSAVETQTVSEIYAKLKDNESWMKKQMFYMTDEPGIVWWGDQWGGQDKLHQAQAVYEQLQSVFPGARINIPVAKNFFQDTYYDYTREDGTFVPGGDRWGWGHVDTLDVCARFSNLMCPCIDIVSTPAADQPDTFNYQYTKEHERVYGPLADRVDAWREQGKEIWWYTANSPHPPMANISQRCTGLENRVLFWEMYKYDVDGFLYWATNDWGAKKRSTIDIDAGVLVYPGSDYDVAGPVACQRAGIMRDGIEDVEYLHMAKDLLGDEWVDALVSRIVRTVNDFETNELALLAVRNELGDAIEAALAE